MKITISKSQWEEMGKKAGWMKIARELMTTEAIFAYERENHSLEELLNHPSYSHSRRSPAWYPNNGELDGVKIYFHCSDSPSGVLMAGTATLTPENQEIIKNHRIRMNEVPSRGDIAAKQWGI